MYKIVMIDSRPGYAYVMDHFGNKCYYGKVKDCNRFIKAMSKEYQRYVNNLKRRVRI